MRSTFSDGRSLVFFFGCTKLCIFSVVNVNDVYKHVSNLFGKPYTNQNPPDSASLVQSYQITDPHIPFDVGLDVRAKWHDGCTGEAQLPSQSNGTVFMRCCLISANITLSGHVTRVDTIQCCALHYFMQWFGSTYVRIYTLFLVDNSSASVIRKAKRLHPFLCLWFLLVLFSHVFLYFRLIIVFWLYS
jgi:hypothetical protein